MFFFHTDSVVWIPKQSDTTHMPMHSSIYAHTVTQPLAQALFSLFPVSHPTTLRSFLLLLAAWDKIQNERKYGYKLASVNCFFLWHLFHCISYSSVWTEDRGGGWLERPPKSWIWTLSCSAISHNWGCISLFEIIFFLYITLIIFFIYF